MTQLMKIAAAAIIGSALGLVMRRSNPEGSLLLGLTVAIFAVYAGLEVAEELLRFLREVADTAGIPAATLAIVLKTAGISVLAKLAAEICRDAGQAGAAAGVEFMGAVTAIYVALPLFRTVMDMLGAMLGL